MTKRTAVVAVAGVLVMVMGFGTGVGFVAAQGNRPQTTATPDPRPAPATTLKPGVPDTPKPEAPPPDEKDLKKRRTKLNDLLAKTEAELAKLSPPGGAEDIGVLQVQVNAQEALLSELRTLLRSERGSILQEVVTQLEKAQQRESVAREAPLPADVLAEAVKLHPKVVEVQAKVKAKEQEAAKLASKLPKEDPALVKASTERATLFNEWQATQKQVRPEVEAYLRVPAVLEARKACAEIEQKLRLIETRVVSTQQEAEKVQKHIEDLRARMSRVEAATEDIDWLKEKRRRLKQELLELELKELGAGK